MHRPIIFILSVVLFISCSNESIIEKKSNQGFIAKEYMVVSAHPEASSIGSQILSNGGNAFDAAIAVEFALAVCLPSAGNIGGGGFMVIRENTGEINSLDYREKAPSLSNRKMFQNKEGNLIDGLSTRSHLSCGVPGTVDGMIKLHEKYGSMSFEDLINPAINLALIGFPVTSKQAEGLNYTRKKFLSMNTNNVAFTKDIIWTAGDTLKQIEISKTLERVRDKGRAGFYEGVTADLIVKEVKNGGGIIGYNDLKEYSSEWRTPVSANYKDYKVISMGPPSSGGICLIQIFKLMEEFPVKSYGNNSLEYVHLFSEAARRVYADRAEFLGDPDFVNIPLQEMISEEYLINRFSGFDPQSSTSSDSISCGNPWAYESTETTHYSIVDKFGNAISATTTLNHSYGSGIVVSGAGFILNNEMDDFSSKPGEPNSFGLIGGDRNAIEPGKRMLSSMTPTILTKGDSLFMVIGSPGGSRIITSVLQSIINVIEFDMTMQEAVSSKRFHHQWLPDKIYYEESALDSLTVLKLSEMGHFPEITYPFCRVDGILKYDNGELEGGADPRGDDIAIGK